MKLLMFAMAFLLMAASSATARQQAGALDLPQPKDPAAASIIGMFVPGAGHVYSGEVLKGVGLFAATTGFAAAGVLLTRFDTRRKCTIILGCTNRIDVTPLVAGSTFALATWIHSVTDAAGAARRTNEHRGRSTFSTSIAPAALSSGDRATVGLQLRLNF